MGQDRSESAPARRPRIVLVVDNHVTVDSRVQKTARAAADSGYDTVILGRSTTHDRIETEVGGVRTILVVAPRHLAAQLTIEPSRGRRWFAYPTRERARDRSRRLTAMRAGQLGRTLELRSGPMGPRAKAEWFWLRARVSWRQRLHNHRYRSFQANVADVANNRGIVRRPALRLGLALTPARTWRRVASELLDYDLAFGPEIAALAPDLIHAHDFPMLVVATNAKARARQAGTPLHVVHDVHEWIAGAPRRDPVWRSAVHHAEVELIPRCDAVITVSDWLSDSIARDCRLTVRPSVITNSPEAPDGDAALVAPSLRERCGLDEGVPIMVYSGAVADGRGLSTVIEAMPLLPDVHLAIVVGSGPNNVYDRLLATCTELGVVDRLHRVDYVPQELVVPHLASADVGLIPIDHAVNHEISLITKYREYMHARLPIVVSDVRTMAEFTREHGTGEVFVAGDCADLARAVRAVLDDPARYRAAFTEELLLENVWATQARRLVDIYASFVGRPPEPETRPTGNASLLPATTAPVSLVIGPTNMAGQGNAWAIAAAHHLADVDAVSTTMSRRSVLQFPTDLRIGEAERSSPAWIARFEAEVCATRTHALLENALPLHAGGSGPVAVHDHVLRLQRAGLHVGYAFHGSEVRDPRIHAATYAWSNFRSADPEWRAALERRVDEVRATLDATPLPMFVSTPDQLTYLPGATWLPTVVDASRFASDRPVLEGTATVVLHAPSRAATKGSAAIDEVLQRLEAEGLIRYRRLEGVAPDEMPGEVAAADVVVEQVGLGLYGVLASEAMAAGRLVVGQVGDVVRGHVRDTTGLDVPVVEAGADTLEDVLRAVLADPGSARATAAQGPTYVADVHDGRRAAGVLAGWLGVLAP